MLTEVIENGHRYTGCPTLILSATQEIVPSVRVQVESKQDIIEHRNKVWALTMENFCRYRYQYSMNLNCCMKQFFDIVES